MDALHVVPEVPVAREAISRNTSLAVVIRTKKWLVAVSMHSVGFAFMAKETSRRRETKFFAIWDLATIWH